MSSIAVRLKSDYSISNHSPLKLYSRCIIDSQNRIHGMESYTTIVATMKYNVSFYDKSSQIDLPFTARLTNERNVESQLAKALKWDSQHADKLLAHLMEFVQENFPDCSTLQSDFAKSVDALDMGRLLSLEQTILASDCENLKPSLESEITKTEEQKLCSDLLHRAEILANGATLKQLQSATNLLLLISPQASCADDAIKLSQLVSQNAQNLSHSQRSSISAKLEMYDSRSLDQWKNYYTAKRTSYWYSIGQ